MTEQEARAVLERGCGDKTRYGPVLADTMAAAFSSDGSTVRKYRCPSCKAWHIGHMPGIAGLREIALALRVLQGCAPGEPTAHKSRRARKRARRQHAR